MNDRKRKEPECSVNPNPQTMQEAQKSVADAEKAAKETHASLDDFCREKVPAKIRNYWKVREGLVNVSRMVQPDCDGFVLATIQESIDKLDAGCKGESDAREAKEEDLRESRDAALRTLEAAKKKLQDF